MDVRERQICWIAPGAVVIEPEIGSKNQNKRRKKKNGKKANAPATSSLLERYPNAGSSWGLAPGPLEDAELFQDPVAVSIPYQPPRLGWAPNIALFFQ